LKIYSLFKNPVAFKFSYFQAILKLSKGIVIQYKHDSLIKKYIEIIELQNKYGSTIQTWDYSMHTRFSNTRIDLHEQYKHVFANKIGNYNKNSNLQ
jgi:hypothetical protein